MNKLQDSSTKKAISGLLILCAMCLFTGSALTLVLQVYQYLRIGAWPAWTTIDSLKYFIGEPWEWLYSPMDWIGIHDLLGKIPASAGFFLSAMACGFLGMVIVEG